MRRTGMNDILELRGKDKSRDARQAYMENQVLDADPQDLLILLYEGLTRFILAGKHNLEDENWEEAAKNLGRARRIVSYLIQLLRPEGGDISRHLRRLYAFCFDHISRATLEKNPELLDGVLQVVRELTGAWNDLAKMQQEK